MGCQIAGTTQQMKQLSDLGLHAKAHVDGAKQLRLGRLGEVDPDARRNVLRDGLDQHPQLDSGAGRVEWKQPMAAGRASSSKDLKFRPPLSLPIDQFPPRE